MPLSLFLTMIWLHKDLFILPKSSIFPKSEDSFHSLIMENSQKQSPKILYLSNFFLLSPRIMNGIIIYRVPLLNCSFIFSISEALGAASLVIFLYSSSSSVILFQLDPICSFKHTLHFLIPVSITFICRISIFFCFFF